MLKNILIKNIVLIKELNIDFKSGLSVLTGETWTGKSIIIDSLGLILGNRANFKLIKSGEEKASVTGIFKLSKNHNGFNYLTSINIDFDDVIIIRREINKNGKSSSFINWIFQSLLSSIVSEILVLSGSSSISCCRLDKDGDGIVILKLSS